MSGTGIGSNIGNELPTNFDKRCIEFAERFFQIKPDIENFLNTSNTPNIIEFTIKGKFGNQAQNSVIPTNTTDPFKPLNNPDISITELGSNPSAVFIVHLSLCLITFIMRLFIIKPMIKQNQINVIGFVKHF